MLPSSLVTTAPLLLLLLFVAKAVVVVVTVETGLLLRPLQPRVLRVHDRADKGRDARTLGTTLLLWGEKYLPSECFAGEDEGRYRQGAQI